VRVSLVQKSVPHYRAPFFECLRDRLSSRGIALDLVYGRSPQGASNKADEVDVDWGTRVDGTWFRVGSAELIWQPVLRHAMRADLVIVEQASRLLTNYVLQMSYVLRGHPRFAFWGHGRNFQARRQSNAPERAKRAVATHAHWWFAYNALSAAVVRSLGFPADRITIVQNAIDTGQLSRDRASLVPQDVGEFRRQLGIASDNVCVFSGGMYLEKRIPFLLDACRRIRERLPDFEMIFMGGGSDAVQVRDAAHANPWIHYLGPTFGKDKVTAFAAAKLHLMPGLVGLAVLDSFALTTPMVTTAVTFHSPEIEYLTPDRGVVLPDPDNVTAYAAEVVSLLHDERRLEAMRRACDAASRVYTIEAMAANFADGVTRALS
jgi:glycosyltransferase involved in cell wall biosynthesis